jgi:hypothetical protein
VIRKRGGSLQVQVFAGRDPLTGRKRWLSRQVPGQTRADYCEAKKVEAQLLEHGNSPALTRPTDRPEVLVSGEGLRRGALEVWARCCMRPPTASPMPAR